MYRKILSFILILCLCMGMMGNTKVCAAEPQGNAGGSCIAIDSSETDGQTESEEEEIVIPQNGSEVLMEGAEAQPAAFSLRSVGATADKRYTVLVLDNSSTLDFSYNGSVIYTADPALPHVKKAAKRFIEDIDDAPGDNYIAVVSFGSGTPRVVSQFTQDTDALSKAIDSLYASGNRSVYSGLTAAGVLIDSVEDQNAIKNVVLFTTGITNTGFYDYTGHYNASTVGGNWYGTDTGVSVYAYANAAYAAAEELKEKCAVYSIGLFGELEDMPEKGRDLVKFFKLCACDWASSKNHFYDIKDPEDLEFVFGQVAESIVKRTGTFSYPGDGRDYTAVYYYDDSYFQESSYVYNQHLATMSLCLDLSAWGSEEESDYTRKMKNAEALLNELEFIGFDHNYTDFSGNGVNGKPTKDSVGVVAANKLVCFDGEEYTLIALAVRGGGYESEWASNFKMGASGDHEGFSEARDIVIAFLQKYIREQGISGRIKLWITGYSRAAATANMVAGAIDSGTVRLDGCQLALEDLFAYTFETPAGVQKSKVGDAKYDNIFNIINLNDPVPKVAPDTWGFGRYGIDRNIYTPEFDGIDVYQEKEAVMLERYRELEGYEGYAVDDFQMKKITLTGWNPLLGQVNPLSIVDDTNNHTSQNAFLNEYITMLAKEFLKSRLNYAANYQDEIRYACGVYFGADATKTERLFEAVRETLSDNLGWILWELSRPGGGEEAAYEKVAAYLRECLDGAGITGYSEEEFDSTVKVLLNLVVAAAVNHPNLASTLVVNGEGIGQAHYPELCLAWMQSMDTNYTTDAGLSFSTGKYRIVRVNCPVDVTVYDAEGSVLASIVDDTPQPDARVVVSLNDRDEKLVYLPVYHDYVIRLTATGDGFMNYAVQEYDPNAGETNHLVLFNDIEIAEGQEYTAYLPAYSGEDLEDRTGAAANTEYTLYLGDDRIPISEELTGEDVFNAYYSVNAAADDTAKGIVFGSGIYQYGTFAKVTAVAYEGYEFVGWYEGEDMISTDAEYRFRVSEDVELAAVFQESSEEEAPENGPDDPTDEDAGEGTDEDTDEEIDKSTGEGAGDRREGTIEGAFRVVSHWDTGFSGEITLTNTTDEVIHNWVVAFDLPYEIVNIWNGIIASHENGVYTVQNAGYNWDIEPGESVTFGFYANAETETITEPTYYALIKKPAKTVKQNYKTVYKVNSDWGTAFNGQIEISNVSSEDILDWTLEFDCDQNFNQFWNAEIVSHKGNHYIIKNKGYNAVIRAGQTLVLGFEASSGSAGSSCEPMNYKLTAADMD